MQERREERAALARVDLEGFVPVGKAWNYLRRRPLHRRLWVLTTLVVTLAVLLSNLAGYLALRSTLLHSYESITMRIARDLVGPAAASIRQTGRLDVEVAQAGGVVVEAVDPDGRVLKVPGETVELVLTANELDAARPDGTSSRRTGVDATGADYAIVAMPLGDTGYALVVARPLTPVLQVLRTEQLILVCVVAASVLAATVAAAFVTRSALRPVGQLTAAVQHAADAKNFQPVSIQYASGMLATLAAAFNQLLRSVTTMRERQARLVADAGHELRTPLTSLTANVDLLASDAKANQLPPAQKDAILRDLRAQLGELNALVGDLVRLSRDDSAGTFRPLDLRDVVQAAVERVRRRGPDRVFDVQLDEFYLVGDPDGLERSVTNLLDNAVKWSPPGSTIRVRLEGNRLRVADSGPGIPETDLPYVFDRFFRGKSARNTHGTGLGLSIVAKTVEDHGGTVTAGRSSDGGAELTIQLPGVTHPEALPTLPVPVA